MDEQPQNPTPTPAPTQPAPNVISTPAPQPTVYGQQQLPVANDQPTGIKGWLVVFVIMIFLSIVITVFNFFQDGFISSSDVDSLNNIKAGLGTTLQNLATFENVAVWLYVALLVAALVTLLMRKKIGKTIAVIALAFGAIYTLVDWTSVYSIFNSASLDMSYLSSYTKSAGQMLAYAAIWIPYIIFSKRVAATLTK